MIAAAINNDHAPALLGLEAGISPTRYCGEGGCNQETPTLRIRQRPQTQAGGVLQRKGRGSASDRMASMRRVLSISRVLEDRPEI